MLGSFEELVMMGVLRAGRESTAAGVTSALEDHLNKDMQLGPVFTTLNRLSSKGYVKKESTGETSKRGRERMRYFITGEGERALNESLNIKATFASKLGLVGSFQNE